jgi:nitric oxide reductase large subunit
MDYRDLEKWIRIITDLIWLIAALTALISCKVLIAG